MYSLGEPPRNGLGTIVGAIPLRLGAALALLHQHVWSQIPQAFQALWNGKSWEMIDFLSKAGLPFPKFLAILGAVLAALVAVGWLLGFVARFCAFLLMPLALVALIACNAAGTSAGAEIAILYFFIAVTVAIFGPGWFSVDALFRRRRSGRSSKKLRLSF